MIFVGTDEQGKGQTPRSDHDLTVGELSEAQLIERFMPLLNSPADAENSGLNYCIVGPGDDCAVVAAPDRRFVISTDTQVQDQDFQLMWPNGVVPSGRSTGHKCVTQNVADAAAMGSVPTTLVISLTLPRTTKVRWVEDFATGVREGLAACGALSCTVVGGDLGAGREICVTATVTGDLEGRDPVRRCGARPGDQLVVVGTVGRAAAGLDLLRSLTYCQGRDAALDTLVRGQLEPVCPVASGVQLACCGATSMIDISDGLVRDAGRIAQASDVAIVVDPVAVKELASELKPAAQLLGKNPLKWVLHGGEDHGLLSTIPAGVVLPQGVRPIGSVKTLPTQGLTPDRVWLGDTPVSQLPEDIRSRGWDHFESTGSF